MTPTFNTSTRPLNDLARDINAWAISKGWNTTGLDMWKWLSLGNIHSEVSELWEAYRNGTEAVQCDKGGACPISQEAEELADIIIRVLHHCARRNIDIDEAVALKMKYNRTRPERHGGKKA